MKTPTTLITFPEVELLPREIPMLRQTFNDCLDWQDDRLHNHRPEGGEIYRYPLIQFRSIEDRAAVFGIGEGCNLLNELIGSPLLPEPFRISVNIRNQETEIKVTGESSTYSISHFLPFNAEKYREWKELPGLVERTLLLEKALTGHLLNFCSSVGYQVPGKSLEVKLKRAQQRTSVTLPASAQRMKFLCFDIIFEANLALPDHIGLGKGKSKGFGILKRFAPAGGEQIRRKETHAGISGNR